MIFIPFQFIVISQCLEQNKIVIGNFPIIHLKIATDINLRFGASFIRRLYVHYCHIYRWKQNVSVFPVLTYLGQSQIILFQHIMATQYMLLIWCIFLNDMHQCEKSITTTITTNITTETATRHDLKVHNQPKLPHPHHIHLHLHGKKEVNVAAFKSSPTSNHSFATIHIQINPFSYNLTDST